MSDYTFYVAALRFVASKTHYVDGRVADMMQALGATADSIEKAGSFTVPADKLELTARAFAGVAAFLQKQILPEAVAEGNKAGETQIRWAIDSAMEAVNLLLSHAAEQAGKAVEVRLRETPADLA